MPFDDHAHRAAAWLKPITMHSGAPATAEALSTGLAGAYGYALAAANPIGQLLYRYTFEGLTEDPSPIIATTPVKAGQVEGYVPNWATKIAAEVLFAAIDGEEGLARCRVSTPSDTGTIVDVSTELVVDAQGNLREGVSPGEPRAYITSRIEASVDLSATTLDDDVVVDVDFALVSPDTTRAIGAYPLAVSVWWE